MGCPRRVVSDSGTPLRPGTRSSGGQESPVVLMQGRTDWTDRRRLAYGLSASMAESGHPQGAARNRAFMSRRGSEYGKHDRLSFPVD